MQNRTKEKLAGQLQQLARKVARARMRQSIAPLHEAHGIVRMMQHLADGALAPHERQKYGGILTGLNQALAALPTSGQPAEITSICQLMDEIIARTREMLAAEQEKKLIMFLPYKASMWDSLESVWRAAAAIRPLGQVPGPHGIYAPVGGTVEQPYGTRAAQQLINPSIGLGTGHGQEQLVFLRMEQIHVPQRVAVHQGYDVAGHIMLQRILYSREIVGRIKEKGNMWQHRRSGNRAPLAILLQVGRIEAAVGDTQREGDAVRLLSEQLLAIKKRGKSIFVDVAEQDIEARLRYGASQAHSIRPYGGVGDAAAEDDYFLFHDRSLSRLSFIVDVIYPI